LARNKPLFKLNRTRNKSGALLLTIRALINRRGDERLTKGRAESAVHGGDAQTGDTRLSILRSTGLGRHREW
jgi:hypothetical protein